MPPDKHKYDILYGHFSGVLSTSTIAYIMPQATSHILEKSGVAYKHLFVALPC